jgi:hypothetical protein
MGRQYGSFEVKSLFEVNSGDFHAISELDPGEVPLISCGDLNNGLVGYYDIPAEKQYAHAITVAYNGSWPLTTKFHPYSFGAKDDVAVLVPREPMADCVMLYVAALLNRMVWRYSYGRKCFKEKLQSVELRLPVSKKGDTTVDALVPARLLQTAIEAVRAGARQSVEQLTPALPPASST